VREKVYIKYKKK